MVKAIEETNDCSIEEVIAHINHYFVHKKHYVNAMTITDIRRWLEKEFVSAEEKKLYAEENNCSYEEAVEKALDRLEKFEMVNFYENWLD